MIAWSFIRRLADSVILKGRLRIRCPNCGSSVHVTVGEPTRENLTCAICHKKFTINKNRLA